MNLPMETPFAIIGVTPNDESRFEVYGWRSLEGARELYDEAINMNKENGWPMPLYRIVVRRKDAVG